MRKLMLAVVLVVACSKEGTPVGASSGSGSAAPGSSAIAGSANAAGSASAAGSAGSAATSSEAFDKALVELESYRAKMCACTDTRCTEAVHTEFKAWRTGLKSKLIGQRPSKDQDQRGNGIDRAMRECRSKIEGATAGSGTPTVSGDPIEAALVELAGFKGKMCQCADKACSDKVQEEYKAWSRALRAKVAEKPNDVQKEKGNVIEKAMKECRKKVEAGTPGTPDSGGKIDAMLVKMEGFRARICACKDKACGGAVEKELETWITAAAKELADAKPSKDQDAKADKLAAEMKACSSKLK